MMLNFFNNIFSKILLSCFLIAIVPLTGLIYQIHLNELDQSQNVKRNLLQALNIAGGTTDSGFQINGVTIGALDVLTNDSDRSLVKAINLKTSQHGIVASVDSTPEKVSFK